MRFIVLLILACLMGCGTHPLSRSQNQQSEEIRRFIADILEPTPGPSLPEIPFKDACLKHLEALYFIINSPDILRKSGIPDEIIKILPRDLEELKGKSLETILKALLEQPDSYFRENQTAIEKAVQDFKFELEQLKSIKIPKLGHSWTEFFQKILNNYFSDADLEDKKRILAFAIRNWKSSDTEIQALLNWVYASGPFFHKYLQLMAKYLEPGDDKKLIELKTGLMNVKNALPSIHPYHLEVYLQELRARNIDLELGKSLGAASVGEVFPAKNLTTGQQFVIKFMRPEIEKIANRERAFFKNQAQLPALKESFEQIADQIAEEMDYLKELSKIKQGILAYENDTYQIHVVKPLDDFPNSQRYFAMEFVNGKTFGQLEKGSAADLITLSILWEKVTRKFMYQALFAEENAFFHGDLHNGNMMATFDPQLNLGDNPTREQVQTAIDQGQIKVVLIDFGNAHELDQNQRQRLKNIFLSAVKINHSAHDFLKAMYPEKADLEPIKLLLEKTAFSEANRGKSAPEKIGEAMDVLLEHEFVIPGFLMAFQRSLGMLEGIYKCPGSSNLHKIAEETYSNNLSTLVNEMSEETRQSTITGIVLHAQAAEFEGEKIADFFENPALKEQWIDLRTRWAQTTEPAEKQNQLAGMMDLILEQPIKQTEQQSGGNTPADSNTLDDLKSRIIKGEFLSSEVMLAEKVLGISKETWTVARTTLATNKARWYSKGFAAIKLFSALPAVIRSKLILMSVKYLFRDEMRDTPANREAMFLNPWW